MPNRITEPSTERRNEAQSELPKPATTQIISFRKPIPNYKFAYAPNNPDRFKQPQNGSDRVVEE